MKRRPIFSALLIAVLAGGLTGSAKGASFVDTNGKGPDSICHGSGSIDEEAMQKDRAAAVFAVMVTNDNHREAKGTATLVDSERGIFLTAAHVVHFYRDSPIYVSQKSRGQNGTREYKVHVFPTASATDDWKNEDLALLQAEQWNKPAQLVAFPLRINAVDGFIKGFFIGQAEDMSNSVFGDFGIAFGDDPSKEMTYAGTVFPHASGAMLLDRQGRAFALILRDAKVEDSLASELKISQLRRILWDRNRFSAFPLSLVLDKLKAIPPSSVAQGLIDELSRNGDDDDFRFGLQRTALNAIDTIHLTDTIVSAVVWQRLSDQAALPDILLEMMPIVEAACTHRYFAEHYSEHFAASHAAIPAALRKRAMNVPTPASSPITKVGHASLMAAAAEVKPAPNPADGFDKFPPDKAEDAGKMFLEGALSHGSGDKLAAVQARLALTLLNRAADKPEMRRAIEDATPNRSYAALMANIALAQDLVGDREAARQSILVADKLGGSPTAYSLAAHYAAAEHDAIAAAGLYARSYAMLSDEDPDGRLRASVNSDFGALASAEPSIRGTKIDQFNIRAFADRGGGRWYALANPPSSDNYRMASFTGVGTTYPFPIYSKWADAYRRETGTGVSYQSIGSGSGIKQIEAKTVTFGASDVPLKPDQLDRAGLVQWPMVMGAIVPIVNIDGVKAGAMVLDGPTLADLYLGKITRWDDPAIKRLNPRLKLPAEPIAVVHRADGSGTTFNFTDYLSKVSEDWKTKVGEGTAVEWPTGVGAKGNEGVSARVDQIKNSIGYIDYSYAKQNQLAYTAMVNKTGRTVQPTAATVGAAAANSNWGSAPGFYFSLTNQPGENSWPIAGANFILMKKAPHDKAESVEAVKFFKWAFTKGGKMAEDLDYVPVPDSLVKYITKSPMRQIGIEENN